MALYYIYMAIVGLCIGSFLNVLIYRIPREESIVKGRSHCTKCDHTLSALELIPVFSYIFLGGKCKSCKAQISPRYPMVELMGGAVFALSALKYGFTLTTPVMALFFCCLIAIAFIDLDTQFMPDALIIAAAALGIISFFCPTNAITLVERLIGLACVSVPLFIIAKLTNGFGMGDVKLMAAAGLTLGWKLTLAAFLIAVVLGGIVAAILLITKRVKRGSAIAFGPYLCLGCFLSAMVGSYIIDFYVGLLIH